MIDKPEDRSEEEWPVKQPYFITDENVERFIADVASSGYVEDAIGMFNRVDSLRHAVAVQWVMNKEMIGSIIGRAFWQWAKSAATACEYGK